MALPGAPTIEMLGHNPGPWSMFVLFTPPVSDGGSPILFYEYRINSGAWNSTGLTSSGIFETYDGLLNNTIYTVEMRAFNVDGYGPISAPATKHYYRAVFYSWDPYDPSSVLFSPGAFDGLTVTSASWQFRTNFDYPAATYQATAESNPSPDLYVIEGRRQANGIRWLLSDPTGVVMSDASRFPVIIRLEVMQATAPTITTAIADNTELTLAFTPPVGDGGSPITDYEYTIDGGLTFESAGTTTSPFTVSLSGTPPYTVQLRAVSSAGNGAISDPVATSSPDDVFKYVYAVSDRVVRVVFNPTAMLAPPVHVSSTGIGDALNPRSWNVNQPYGIEYTVLSVLGSDDGYTYDILTLEHFPRYNAGDLIFTGEVTLENGGTASISTEFSGSIQSADTSANDKATARGLQVRDLNNVVTPYEDLIGGTLVINSGGDYESMSGEAFIRKLVMRRLISQRGDFFHLPNYGGGLRVKATFSTANLRAMAKDIEMQVLQEPEIEAARASLTYQAASSTLVIQVKARMRSTGQETALSMNLPVGSIQF